MSSLDDTRIAMKFSLWMWAIYWPGGGLLLLAGGMTDPVSILVAAGTLAGFALVVAAGGVEPSSSRSMRAFMVERPLAILGGAVVLALLSTLLPTARNVALALFAALHLAGIIGVGVAVRRHMRATGSSARRVGADEVAVALLLGGVAAAAVAVDAALELFSGAAAPGTSMTVAMLNWLGLAYPGLLLVAMRPLREPLRNPLRRRAPRARADATPMAN